MAPRVAFKCPKEHCLCCGSVFVKEAWRIGLNSKPAKKVEFWALIKKYTGIDYIEGNSCRNCFFRVITINNKVDKLSKMCAVTSEKFATKVEASGEFPGEPEDQAQLQGPEAKRCYSALSPTEIKQKLRGVVGVLDQHDNQTIDITNDQILQVPPFPTILGPKDVTVVGREADKNIITSIKNLSNQTDIADRTVPKVKPHNKAVTTCVPIQPKIAKPSPSSSPKSPSQLRLTYSHEYIEMDEAGSNGKDNCLAALSCELTPSEDIEFMWYDDKKQKKIGEPALPALLDHTYTDLGTKEEADARCYLFGSKFKEKVLKYKNYLTGGGEQSLSQLVWKQMAVAVLEQNLTRFVEEILSCETLRESIINSMGKEYGKKTAYEMGKRKKGAVSVLMKKEQEDLEAFDWLPVINEASEIFPDLVQLMISLSFKPSNLESLPSIKEMVPRLGLIYSILAQSSNIELSAVQRLMSFIIFNQRCDARIYEIFQPLGLCLSFKLTQSIYYKLEGDFCTNVINWVKHGKSKKLFKDALKTDKNPEESKGTWHGVNRTYRPGLIKKRKDNLKKSLAKSKTFEKAIHKGKAELHDNVKEDSQFDSGGSCDDANGLSFGLDLEAVREVINEKRKEKQKSNLELLEEISPEMNAGANTEDRLDINVWMDKGYNGKTLSQDGQPPKQRQTESLLDTAAQAEITSDAKFQVVAASQADIKRQVDLARKKNMEVYVLSKEEYEKVLLKEDRTKTDCRGTMETVNTPESELSPKKPSHNCRASSNLNLKRPALRRSSPTLGATTVTANTDSSPISAIPLKKTKLSQPMDKSRPNMKAQSLVSVPDLSCQSSQGGRQIILQNPGNFQILHQNSLGLTQRQYQLIQQNQVQENIEEEDIPQQTLFGASSQTVNGQAVLAGTAAEHINPALMKLV